jgi:hypothetical protein
MHRYYENFNSFLERNFYPLFYLNKFYKIDAAFCKIFEVNIKDTI